MKWSYRVHRGAPEIRVKTGEGLAICDRLRLGLHALEVELKAFQASCCRPPLRLWGKIEYRLCRDTHGALLCQGRDRPWHGGFWDAHKAYTHLRLSCRHSRPSYRRPPPRPWDAPRASAQPRPEISQWHPPMSTSAVHLPSLGAGHSPALS